MKLALVGVGTGGSRIVNRILGLERSSGRTLSNGNALLVNSKEPTFDTTERVPAERRLTIGDVHGAVDSTGTGGDPDLGAEVARRECDEIIRAFDRIEFHQVDGVLVVAGLAGGTGGGAGAVVIEQLQSICDEPVYGVGVLPSESEGQRAALTAARALQSFVGGADNVLAFDNDAWRDGAPPDHEPDATDRETEADAADEPDAPVGGDATEADFTRANAELAERIVGVFAASAPDGESAPENRLDPSDVIRTLETGGVSTVGYASTDVPSTGAIRSAVRAVRDLLPWTADGEAESTDAAKINRLVRRAARSNLTLPCEVSSADRALITLSGPPRALSRKGFETGRYWLEDEADVAEVRAGDEPHERSRSLTAVVLFSNVTDVPRIDAMQRQAVDGDLARGSDSGSSSGSGWKRFETADPQ